MRKHIALLFLNYLRIIAKAQLSKIKLIQILKGKPLKIIGITGSAGKSSVLYILEAILKPKFIVKTNLLYNSESGIPLNILDLKVRDYSLKNWLLLSLLAPFKLITNWRTYEVYLVEMGIDEPDEPKNMSFLLKILKPDISIFLNVTPVHSLQFDKTVPTNFTGTKRLDLILDNIAQEKSQIITSLPKSGIGIINALDPKVVSSTTEAVCSLFTVGKEPKHTISIRAISTGPNGFSVGYKYSDQIIKVSLPKFVLPQAYAVSIGVSLLAAFKLGLTSKDAVTNLQSNLSLPPSRSTLFKGIKDSLIIDSTYNSSLLATTEMLNLLSLFPSPKIAILGDLRETGESSSTIHTQIYNQAIKSCDQLIGVGPETKKYFKTADNCHTFTYWWQAADHLKSSLKPKSSILVKGSQNTIYLEEIVKLLLKNRSDSKLICRQSAYWKQTKASFLKKNK